MPTPTGPGPYNLASTFVHLREGGGGDPIAVTDTFWDELAQGKRPELERGRLMSQFAFAEDWPVWERHPQGDELVLLLSGSVDFILEQDGAERIVALRSPGSFVLVPASAWHTARPQSPSTMLFVTPGQGTEHRPVAQRDAARRLARLGRSQPNLAAPRRRRPTAG